MEESPEGGWLETSLSASRNSPFDNLGFQGSLGFEYMVSRKVGFFVEALGRYARFKNFGTATALYRNNVGNQRRAKAGSILRHTRPMRGL
jgi:hypothetical protein